jgi:hypothetical protein
MKVSIRRNQKIFFGICFLATNLVGVTEAYFKEMSTAKKIIIGSVIGAGVVTGAVLAAPAILPASTVLATKAAIGTVVTKFGAIASACYVSDNTKLQIDMFNKGSKLALSLVNGMKAWTYMGRDLKDYYYPNDVQRLERLIKQEALEAPFEEQLQKAFEIKKVD